MICYHDSYHIGFIVRDRYIYILTRHDSYGGNMTKPKLKSIAITEDNKNWILSLAEKRETANDVIDKLRKDYIYYKKIDCCITEQV